MTYLESYAKHARVWGYYSGDRKEEADCWETLAKSYGTSILALMSATGEMAAMLARRGFQVCAVDFIPEMIQEGEKRYGDISALTFVEGDVRYLKLDRNDYEFAFTSDFNHLLSRDDCMAALTGIRQALRPKAGLGLELSFPATESWNKPWQTFEPLTSQLDIAIKDSAILKTWKKGKTSYDAVSRVTSIEQEIFIKQGKTVEQFPHNFQLKLWDSQEISAMLQEAGFSLNNEYGSYKLEPWTTKSHRWIIEAVKNSS